MHGSTLKFQQKVAIEQIEKCINEDADLDFDNPNYSYEKKLEKLYEYETQLLDCDRSRKANRRDVQSICRIQESICQSYFIFDYPDFDIARGFYYEGLAALQDVKSTMVTKFSELLKNKDAVEEPPAPSSLHQKSLALKNMNSSKHARSSAKNRSNIENGGN